MKVLLLPFQTLIEIIHQLTRFSICGVCSFVLDLAILYYLVTTLAFPYYVAVPIAFLLAVAAHYVSCRWFVFRDSPRPYASGFFYFFFILFAVLILTLSIVTALVELWEVNIFAARIIASAFAGIASFYLNSRFNFKMLPHAH